MFFEGSEKKIEIVIEGANLLEIKNDYWHKIVESCHAQILSMISNERCKAFLLSESSLFVWSDRVVMITCGKTVLLNSILMLVSDFGSDKISCLTFQRKNEYYSHLQETTFEQDIEKLKTFLPGVALRFGDLDGHHNYLFHLDRPYSPSIDDKTSELLLYHIQGETAEALRCENMTRESVRKALRIDELFPDFVIDDFVFEPCGYSLNGIKGDDYITFHVTPEEGWSYVSFETSLDIEKENKGLLENIVRNLNPVSFDLISFNIESKLDLNEYNRIDHVSDKLKSGYYVDFTHYRNETIKSRKAEVL